MQARCARHARRDSFPKRTVGRAILSRLLWFSALDYAVTDKTPCPQGFVSEQQIRRFHPDSTGILFPSGSRLTPAPHSPARSHTGAPVDPDSDQAPDTAGFFCGLQATGRNSLRLCRQHKFCCGSTCTKFKVIRNLHIPDQHQICGWPMRSFHLIVLQITRPFQAAEYFIA